MKPPVLLTRKLPSSVVARLEASCDVERFEGDANMPHEALVERLAGKHGLLSLITDSVDRAPQSRPAPQLRVIANVGVGYNNIDVAAARGRGIIVTNTPDILTDATADFTIALILAVTRRLGEGERMIRRREWKGWALDQLLGMQLGGKQLGIVGYGRIGRAVAARAATFGMKVAHTSRSR